MHARPASNGFMKAKCPDKHGSWANFLREVTDKLEVRDLELGMVFVSQHAPPMSKKSLARRLRTCNRSGTE